MMEVDLKSITRRCSSFLICWVTLLVIFSLFSCQSPAELELDRARKQENYGNIERALSHYRRTILRTDDEKIAVEAALSGARLAMKKSDFKQTIQFHRKVINLSQSAVQRLASQKTIADILFDQKNDYSEASKEIQRVISLESNPNELSRYRLMLAKSQFYLKKLFQAEVEAKSVINASVDHEVLFDAKLLLANIYQAGEKSKKAISLYEELVKEFPVLSRNQNVGMNLAMTFEENLEFEKAIEVLKLIRDHYPTPEYIDLKMKRLAERAQNLPGARGLRK